MVIAVDARFFRTDNSQDHFIEKLFCKLAQLYKNNQFIFFFDKSTNDQLNTTENITQLVITPAATNFFLYKFWYDIKLALALKKHKADVFIGTNGSVSLTSKTPQLLIIQNPGFLHNSVRYPTSIFFFYKKFTAAFLKKAAATVTFSDFTKQEIINTYKVSEQKITAISCAADSSFKPLNWEDKEEIKEQFSQGCEYFIYHENPDNSENFINVLKAFSIFKKWQKTNMKLLITIFGKTYKEHEEKLKSYKYKSEINLIRNLAAKDFAQVTAGAYAIISSSFYDVFGLHLLEAMQCEVPVITSAQSSVQEITGDAALYADAAKPEEIAEQMKRIFKDEQLRNKLVAAGKERAKLFNFDKTAALLWQEIEKVVTR